MTVVAASGAGGGGESEYGVSASELTNLYDSIRVILTETAQEAINNTGGIENSLAEAWHGPDEERFVENLHTFCKEVCEALNKYNTAIQQEFQSVEDQWVEFQNKNVQ